MTFSSPRFELPIVKDEGVEKKLNITCHSCGQPGHKASVCPQNQMKENKVRRTTRPLHRKYLKGFSVIFSYYILYHFYLRLLFTLFSLHFSFQPNTYIQLNPSQVTDQQVFGRRPLETVTCFKVNMHYISECVFASHKGDLGFIPSLDGVELFRGFSPGCLIKTFFKNQLPNSNLT